MPYENKRPSRGGFKKRSSGGYGGNSGSSYGGGYRSNRPPQRKGPKKAYINPTKFVKAAKLVEEVPYDPTHQFTDFGLHEKLEKNLSDRKYVTPTPIQDQSIPHGLRGVDVIGIANTGTGKTIAFALPVLHRILSDPSTRALIMAPTRELAQQIEEEMKVVSFGTRIDTAVLIGGAAMGPQLNALRRRPQVVIGTPGRIKDHIERGSLKPQFFNVAVLDEVDRMLDMGFVNDMKTILSQMHPEKQSFFYSATMTPTVEALMEAFMNNPVTISVKTSATSDNVEQDVVRYSTKEDRIQKLYDLLNEAVVEKSLVFGETKRGVERLAKSLEEKGFKVDAIHGGKSQGQRQRALRKFKKSEVTILVATDVAARGIDVKDITHVINYETPQTYEDYAHRIGRAGRAGRKGYAFTFIEH